MAERDEPGRVPALDGVRGIAVFSVIVAHTMPLDRIPGRSFHFGRFGVDIFFALSGYLITGILLRAKDRLQSGRLTRARALGAFYARRAMRIVPAYALTLLICVLAGYAPVRDHILWFLTWTVNFAQVFFNVPVGFADHCWSLSLEEQFYLVWPAIVLALPPRSRRRSLWLLLSAVTAANAAVAFSGASFLFNFRLPFLGSMIPLFLGAVLAEEDLAVQKGERPPDRRLERALWSVGLPLCVLTQAAWFRQSARENPTYVAAIDIAFATVSVALLAHLLARTGTASPLVRIFAFGPLRWLGVLSYGVYLAHRLLMLPVQSALIRLHLDGQPPIFLAAVTLASVGAAALSWYGVERPVQSLKRYFPYAPRG